MASLENTEMQKREKNLRGIVRECERRGWTEVGGFLGGNKSGQAIRKCPRTCMGKTVPQREEASLTDSTEYDDWNAKETQNCAQR